MQYRKLGRTDLDVSLLGMGTGGHDPLGANSGRSEAAMKDLLRHAFDLGINLFDTSPGYANGRSERILGKALQELPREEVVVSTKIPLASTIPGEPARIMEPAEISDYVEASLQRLQLEAVDIMLIAVSGLENFQMVVED